jgi:hypothetical protein
VNLTILHLRNAIGERGSLHPIMRYVQRCYLELPLKDRELFEQSGFKI